MGICLAVTSGKGGTGKSTVSSGLAISFAKLNKSVLLIDLDERLGCLDLFFGIDANIVFDLSDIVLGKDTEDALYQVPLYGNIKLIPAPKKSGVVTPEVFNEFIKSQCEIYDIVIIDMPAGVDFSLIKNLEGDVRYITVSNPDPVSVRDAAVVCGELAESGRKPRLIINRFNAKLIKNKTYRNIDDIIDTSGLRLLGIVPQTEDMALLPINHKLKKRGNAQKALLRIAGRISGNDVPLPNPKKI